LNISERFFTTIPFKVLYYVTLFLGLRYILTRTTFVQSSLKSSEETRGKEAIGETQMQMGGQY